MLRYLIVVGGILLLIGCSSNPTNPQTTSLNTKDSNTSLIKLSYVKAYLLIGNIKQAQTTFDNIDNKQMLPLAGLVQAELSAASGDVMGAQQAFLLAIQNEQLVENSFSDNLLGYFCTEKKWPALQGYGEALLASAPDNNAKINSKNTAITQIGMCFYAQQRWSEASYWLEKIEVSQATSPLVYLVLARAKIEQQQHPAAKELMFKFEARKTEIDARSLWTTIEVYRALNQSAEANKYGNHLRSLFPNNQFTRKYLVLMKRKQRKNAVISQITRSIPDEIQVEPTIHIIKKGETLYQLSKRYGVTIPELQAWNPDLVINDISVGTKIQITRNQ